MFVFHVVFFVINVCDQGKTLCSPCKEKRSMHTITGAPQQKFPIIRMKWTLKHTTT